MTRPKSLFVIASLLSFLIAATCHAQQISVAPDEGATLDAVKSWLRENAMPLRTVEAGNGFADMQPLRKVIGNARVVSLGEATHGTREFFQLKHRMLEFLVSEMGFTLFGIEATMPESFDINEYVLTGKGDPARALAGLYFWTWDTEETLAMIEWMRRYNADPRHTKKVKFYGFDMQAAPRAARVTLAYLRKVDPEQAAEKEKSLALIANPLTDPDFEKSPAPKKEETAAAIDAVLKRLDERKEEFVKKTSESELAMARQHARIVAQNLEMRRSTQGPIIVRDRSMAENIRWVLDHEGPGAKMLVWAHNGHVATKNQYGIEWMGSHLRKSIGAEMVVFGFAFNQGGFQAMELPLETGKGLRPFNVGPAPAGSLDATLAAAGLQIAAIDLRSLPKNGIVAKWFAEPKQTRSIGSGYSEQMAANFLAKQVTPQLYDALLFVEKTSAARPNNKRDARDDMVKLAAPTNLDFEEGEVGKIPAGWMPLPTMSRFGFELTVRDERPYSGKRCAMISRSADKYYGETAGGVMQRIDAAAYRAKRVKLRVMARAETAGQYSQAYLRFRVGRPGAVVFDSQIDYPVTTADWRAYEIEADAPDDADAISYGIHLVGKGRAWLDAVSIEASASGAPAQEKPQPAKAPEAAAKTTFAEPTVDQILDKYEQAIGGRQAVEKITSRVTKGTFESPAMGLKGEVEIYDKAPNKSLTIQNLTGFGEVREGYDGKIAWSQDPMTGLREMSGSELAETAREADIHAVIKTRQLYSKLELKGKEKIGDRETYVILATPAEGAPVTMYFDAQTGLLAREDKDLNTPEGDLHVKATMEDYREVDGVKIAFTTRQETPMGSIVIKLTEVKHNLAIDDAKFNKPSGQ
jgi:erythromycin esterase